MILDSLVAQVSLIEKVIKDIRATMRHSDPQSVDVLRKYAEELERVYEELMDSCVVSNFDLESMLQWHNECLRNCFRPSYTGEQLTLPKPKWDVPPPPKPDVPPPPTVPGVNLILYVDTSGSMRNALSEGGAVRKELEAFAAYLKSESERANIPCTVSLIWFGDRTDNQGDGENYYTIAMNKETVANFPAKVSNPVRYKGGTSAPESGILCMKETLSLVVKPGVANTLIYITDAASKENELGATPAHVKRLFQDYDIKAYAIHPTSKGPNISDLFVEQREYSKPPYNILPWADSTLRP